MRIFDGDKEEDQKALRMLLNIGHEFEFQHKSHPDAWHISAVQKRFRENKIRRSWPDKEKWYRIKE